RGRAPSPLRGSTRPRRPAGRRPSAPAGSFPLPRRARRSRALDPPDHETDRLRHDGAVADPEVEDAAQLVLVDVPLEPAEDGRPLPRAEVDPGAEPVRNDPREVPLDPAAGDVRKGANVRRAAELPDLVEVEPRRREQV